MGFVKKNAFLLGCGAMALASLATMFWGMARMSRVQGDMAQAQGLDKSFASYSKNPVNIEAIRHETERINLIAEYHNQVMSHFTEKNVRKPLLEKLLPDPSSNKEGKRLQYDFLSRYRMAMQELLVILKAGHPPTPQEIDDTRDYLKKKELEATQFGETSGQNGGNTLGGALGGQVGGRKKQEDLPVLPEIVGPENAHAYWKGLEERAKVDPEMLKSISRAREINCYANLDPRGGTFDMHPIFLATDRRPTMKEIWDAQLLYWLQEDIVTTIANVNKKAALKLGDNEEPWVGNLPVKDVISIRISDFVRESKGAGEDRGSQSPGMPTRDADACFTHLASQTLFDVYNITLRLAVDVRDLPLILSEFSNERYFMVLNVNYKVVPPNLTFKGKVYGPEPVVEATIDLQTYLCYRACVPMMPKSVREILGTQKQFEQLLEEREGKQGKEDQGSDSDA